MVVPSSRTTPPTLGGREGSLLKTGSISAHVRPCSSPGSQVSQEKFSQASAVNPGGGLLDANDQYPTPAASAKQRKNRKNAVFMPPIYGKL